MDFQLSSSLSNQLFRLIVVEIDAVSVFQNSIGQNIILIGSEMNDAQLMSSM